MKARLIAGALGVLTAVSLGVTQAAQANTAQANTARANTARANTARAHATPAASKSKPCGTEARPHAYKHVIWIWMENKNFTTIVGSSHAPYLNALARECGLATSYHNVTHPSLPNYIAATSGLSYSALHGFLPDCVPSRGCETTARSIFAQGETWKAYEESMPSNCDRSNAGKYAVRHNPPAYYTRLRNCSSSDVPFARLSADLARNRLPAFSFITPNLIDDMHNGTVADGDSWLSVHLPAIFNSAEYRGGSTVVFITWDEGEEGSNGAGEHCATSTKDASCHVATLILSPSTKAGARSGTLFNHYSLLGTAEQLLGLPKLGLAASYPTMTKAFNL